MEESYPSEFMTRVERTNHNLHLFLNSSVAEIEGLTDEQLQFAIGRIETNLDGWFHVIKMKLKFQ